MVTLSPRKLAVILHADVVDSTRLVQADESLAHERIRDTFRRLSDTVRRYGGVSRELRGDAVVAEFARASDAVTAALACQAGNAQYNAGLDDDAQPRLRVGIGMGEVVVADNMITGTGVVLAQRLEQLAKPGGVCIQGAAYETVPRRLPYDYENLGEQELKGFDEPVRAYSVEPKQGLTIPAPECRGRSRGSRLVVAVVALFLFSAVLVRTAPWPDTPILAAYSGCILVVERLIVCKISAGAAASAETGR